MRRYSHYSPAPVARSFLLSFLLSNLTPLAYYFRHYLHYEGGRRCIGLMVLARREGRSWEGGGREGGSRHQPRIFLCASKDDMLSRHSWHLRREEKGRRARAGGRPTQNPHSALHLCAVDLTGSAPSLPPSDPSVVGSARSAPLLPSLFGLDPTAATAAEMRSAR